MAFVGAVDVKVIIWDAVCSVKFWATSVSVNATLYIAKSAIPPEKSESLDQLLRAM